MGEQADACTIALDAIRAVLTQILPNEAKRLTKVRMETSLIDDLAMDSFLFVDLTMMLEERLRIEKLPMQRWADAEIECGGHFTIGSLVELCAEVIGSSGAAPSSTPAER